ncbi:MAG: hypothetical protein ACU84Q_08120 [Gammaproteobacteria bacterium]
MRLSILDNGHKFTQKLLFKIISLQMGHIPGPMRILTYRRNWFGANFATCLQDGLRKMTEWTMPEAELIAAFVSKLNQCEY